MDSPVQEIKKHIDIVEFVGSFVPLKKAGRNFKANCPFHHEKNPSFIVSPDRQLWRCFGSCQDGGDVIKFLMKWENITFFEALRDLAQKTGVKLENIDFEDNVWKRKKKIIIINSYALKAYQYVLHKKKVGKEALDYLKSRDVSEKVIKTFELGYAPKTFQTLVTFFKSKGFSPNDLLDAGLVIKKGGNNYYDRFRERLIFPIKDARGNVIGFSGRLIKDTPSDTQMAKYINTPETPVYQKRETLYGIHLTKGAISKKDRAIVVEGEFDMISCFQRGINNVVAIKGSAFTKDQLMLIKRYTKKITLALDADPAGLETTKRALSDAERLDFRVEIATFDFGKDPDDAVRKDEVRFKKILKKPIPIYDFIIKTAQKTHGLDNPYSKKAIADEVIPYIMNIENPILYDYYKKKLAKLLSISEHTIEQTIQKIKRKKIRRRVIKHTRTENAPPRYEFLQQFILSVIFQCKTPSSMYNLIFTTLTKDDFSVPAYISIIEAYEEYRKETKQEDFQSQVFVNLLPPQLHEVFDQIYLYDINLIKEDGSEKELQKILYELKKLSLRSKIASLISHIDEKKENKKNLTILTKKLADIEKKLALM